MIIGKINNTIFFKLIQHLLIIVDNFFYFSNC